MSRVYVETSIPSFYYEVRTEPEMVARRSWTRKWWDSSDPNRELFSSLAVIDELRRGGFPGKDDALQKALGLPMLEIDDSILHVVESYISHRVMPRHPFGDALHLALASYHHCDFLVTWNCQHLANARKFGHIRRVNGIIGLAVPALVTPLEMLGEDPP